MTPEIYRQAGELFERLRQLPEGELPAALDAAGISNELRVEVLRLIEADRKAARSFLENRAVEDAARLLAPETQGLPAAGTGCGRDGRRV